MNKKLKQRRPSSLRLRITRRLRSSWVSFSLTRTTKRLKREETRLLLMKLQQDSQLLLLKELNQKQQSLLHRQSEESSSLTFHTTPPTTPSEPTDLPLLLARLKQQS